MSKYLTGPAPVVTAALAIFTSALGVWMASSVYARDIQRFHRGGMGFDYLGLPLWLAISVPFTLLAVARALVLALVRRRWIWVCALVAVLALGCLGLVESTSDMAYNAVSLVVGGGALGLWQFVVEFPVLVLVSLFALISVLVEARRSR